MSSPRLTLGLPHRPWTLQTETGAIGSWSTDVGQTVRDYKQPVIVIAVISASTEAIMGRRYELNQQRDLVALHSLTGSPDQIIG